MPGRAGPRRAGVEGSSAPAAGAEAVGAEAAGAAEDTDTVMDEGEEADSLTVGEEAADLCVARPGA